MKNQSAEIAELRAALEARPAEREISILRARIGADRGPRPVVSCVYPTVSCVYPTVSCVYPTVSCAPALVGPTFVTVATAPRGSSTYFSSQAARKAVDKRLAADESREKQDVASLQTDQRAAEQRGRAYADRTASESDARTKQRIDGVEDALGACFRRADYCSDESRRRRGRDADIPDRLRYSTTSR